MTAILLILLGGAMVYLALSGKAARFLRELQG